jgi:hypothetical protein
MLLHLLSNLNHFIYARRRAAGALTQIKGLLVSIFNTIAENRFLNGGESGIRTHGPRERSPVFKTGAFNRSAISPSQNHAPSGMAHEDMNSN